MGLNLRLRRCIRVQLLSYCFLIPRHCRYHCCHSCRFALSDITIVAVDGVAIAAESRLHQANAVGELPELSIGTSVHRPSVQTSPTTHAVVLRWRDVLRHVFNVLLLHQCAVFHFA